MLQKEFWFSWRVSWLLPLKLLWPDIKSCQKSLRWSLYINSAVVTLIICDGYCFLIIKNESHLFILYRGIFNVWFHWYRFNQAKLLKSLIWLSNRFYFLFAIFKRIWVYLLPDCLKRFIFKITYVYVIKTRPFDRTRWRQLIFRWIYTCVCSFSSLDAIIGHVCIVLVWIGFSFLVP